MEDDTLQHEESDLPNEPKKIHVNNDMSAQQEWLTDTMDEGLKGKKDAGKEIFYDKIESIIFVESTPKSSLSKMLQKKEEAFAKGRNINKIRFIERVG